MKILKTIIIKKCFNLRIDRSTQASKIPPHTIWKMVCLNLNTRSTKATGFYVAFTK